MVLASPIMHSPDELTDLFRASGRKATPQRQCIFRLLQGNGEHPSADHVYEAARAEMPTISLKTVYQTVHDLEAMGEVTLLDLGTGSVRVDPNVEHRHHHLICSVCGKVRDVTVDVGSLRLAPRDRRGFSVADVQVHFRGVCEECAPSASA